MRLYLSSAILTLAWFSALNIALASVVWLAVRMLQRWPNRIRPGALWLFMLRMTPSLIAALFVLGVFLPVHWMYEGREGSEYFGAFLWSLSLLGVGLLGNSAWRVASALRECRRLKRTWIGPADERRPLVSDGNMVGISLAGVLRTTIVVGKCVREALTPEELEVALAHEVAHRRSWDNVKRFAMFAVPDVLRLTKVHSYLEREWSREVECLADARAVEGDASRAANLASALLKVARLATSHPGASASGPLWSTFYEEAMLETRVRRLMNGHAAPPRPSWRPILASGAAACGAVALTWLADVPRTVHFVTEGLVRLLP